MLPIMCSPFRTSILLLIILRSTELWYLDCMYKSIERSVRIPNFSLAFPSSIQTGPTFISFPIHLTVDYSSLSLITEHIKSKDNSPKAKLSRTPASKLRPDTNKHTNTRETWDTETIHKPEYKALTWHDTIELLFTGRPSGDAK